MFSLFGFGKKEQVKEPETKPYNYIFNSPLVLKWMQDNPIAASMYQEIERVLNNLTKRIEKLEGR